MGAGIGAAALGVGLRRRPAERAGRDLDRVGELGDLEDRLDVVRDAVAVGDAVGVGEVGASSKPRSSTQKTQKCGLSAEATGAPGGKPSPYWSAGAVGGARQQAAGARAARPRSSSGSAAASAFSARVASGVGRARLALGRQDAASAAASASLAACALGRDRRLLGQRPAGRGDSASADDDAVAAASLPASMDVGDKFGFPC